MITRQLVARSVSPGPLVSRALFTGAALVAVPGLAMAQTAGSGDTAVDTAVNSGVTSLTSHIGTWAPELIGLAVLVAALTMALTWVKKRA